MAVIVDVPCVTCAVCGRDATRMFTMPQLITEPIHLSEAFRIDPETDGLEARHKQDKAYEDSWKPAPQEEIDKDNLEREQLVKSYA